MRNEDLTQLLTNNPGLKELLLNRCFQISQLPDHPGLNFLSLTKMSLVAIKGEYPALTSLQFEDCPDLNEIVLTNAPIQRLTAKNCPGLKSLQLNDCQQIRNEDLAQLLTNNPGLNKLILNRCSQISQLPDHPGLNFLSLTKMSLVAIKGEYPALTSLQFEDCPHLNEIVLTNAPIQRLTAKNCPGLKSLQLNDCQQIRNEDLAQLLTNNPDLKQLLLNCCSQITQLPDHPGLNFISLTKTPLVAIKGEYPALTTFTVKIAGI